METLKQRSVDYTLELWKFYRHKASLVYEKIDGVKMPTMIHIHETQRLPWKNEGHVSYTGSYKREFNPVLDLNYAQKLDQTSD